VGKGLSDETFTPWGWPYPGQAFPAYKFRAKRSARRSLEGWAQGVNVEERLSDETFTAWGWPDPGQALPAYKFRAKCSARRSLEGRAQGVNVEERLSDETFTPWGCPDQRAALDLAHRRSGAQGLKLIGFFQPEFFGLA
jgi:hypothetical protein